MKTSITIELENDGDLALVAEILKISTKVAEGVKNGERSVTVQSTDTEYTMTATPLISKETNEEIRSFLNEDSEKPVAVTKKQKREVRPYTQCKHCGLKCNSMHGLRTHIGMMHTEKVPEPVVEESSISKLEQDLDRVIVFDAVLEYVHSRPTGEKFGIKEVVEHVKSRNVVYKDSTVDHMVRAILPFVNGFEKQKSAGQGGKYLFTKI